VAVFNANIPVKQTVTARRDPTMYNNLGGLNMKLTVTGNVKEYADDLTVAQLIELEKVETPMYVTVSINDEFVDSGAFEKTALRDGDSVEFLYFMGGGRI
jgi:sulfur carrier protein